MSIFLYRNLSIKIEPSQLKGVIAVKNKNKLHKRIISRHTVIFLLLLLSLAMSSTTFAYWAGYVEGAFDQKQVDFNVGSYTFDDNAFCLHYENDKGVVAVDTNILVDNIYRTGQEIEVSFCANWIDELRDDDINAKISIHYELYGEINGKEINKNQYMRILKALDISLNPENPEYLLLNDDTEAFNITIGTVDNAKNNDYKTLGRTNLLIQIHYEIEYETEGDID